MWVDFRYEPIKTPALVVDVLEQIAQRRAHILFKVSFKKEPRNEEIWRKVLGGLESRTPAQTRAVLQLFAAKEGQASLVVEFRPAVKAKGDYIVNFIGENVNPMTVSRDYSLVKVFDVVREYLDKISINLYISAIIPHSSDGGYDVVLRKTLPKLVALLV